MSVDRKNRQRREFCGAGSFITALFLGSLLVLSAGSWGMSVRAQTIRVKLVNGKNGHPMENTCVNVWVGTKQKWAMAIPTDKDGVARLRITENDSEVDTGDMWKPCGTFGVRNPVVKFADHIRINAGYVLCLPDRPHYSWLATVTFSTRKIVQSGIVTANTCGKAKASPIPGEIVLFVRPLNFWEKMKE